MEIIRVLQIGMGPLGVKIASFIEERKGIATVAVVDNNPELVGKSLTSLNNNLKTNLTIKASISEAIKEVNPDVAILTTVSDMERISPQIEEIISHNVPVVSTCEELSYPWITSPTLSDKIDALAKAKNVAVVGTGVNPGFLMDALPAFMTSVSQHVEKVTVKRFQNAAFRRIPFQRKIGAGLTVEEFELRKKSKVLRHVGLTESMHLIASSLGWKLDRTIDEINPVLAENKITTSDLEIAEGDARGVNQVGSGFINGEEKITLIFQAAIGEESTYDEIEIIGDPNINSRIEGGVNGDVATCAITINATKQILRASSGLKTMADLPLVTFFE